VARSRAAAGRSVSTRTPCCRAISARRRATSGRPVKTTPSTSARIAASAAPTLSPQSRRAENRASGTATRAAATSAPNQPGPAYPPASGALRSNTASPDRAAAVSAAVAWASVWTMMAAIAAAFPYCSSNWATRASSARKRSTIREFWATIAVICSSIRISVSSWRNTIVVSTLMPSRINAISSKIRHCWVARNSRVIASQALPSNAVQARPPK
jgi:hypothetical protein